MEPKQATIYLTLYRKLLRLYPGEYRRQFEESMMQTFDDLCNERGREGMFGFALWAFGDTSVGILKEHVGSILNNKHMRNAPIAMLGLILIIPFCLLFGIGMIWQFLHTIGYAGIPNITSIVPNRALGFAIVFTLPVLAFLANFIALIVGAVEAGPGSVLRIQFARVNAAPLAIMLLSAGAMVFAFGHDSIPCFVHGILTEGLRNFWPLIQTCRGA